MATLRTRKRLLDAYAFPGFRPGKTVKGIFGDPQARVITLARRSKKRPVALVAKCIPAGTTGRCGEYATCPVPTRAFTWTSKYGA
ncbi:MAG TPA: hypothetical protein VJQ25_07830, partial [Nitrospira sp.]|nr:hypothetical protein [Nitrospira sp.]